MLFSKEEVEILTLYYNSKSKSQKQIFLSFSLYEWLKFFLKASKLWKIEKNITYQGGKNRMISIKYVFFKKVCETQSSGKQISSLKTQRDIIYSVVHQGGA